MLLSFSPGRAWPPAPLAMGRSPSCRTGPMQTELPDEKPSASTDGRCAPPMKGQLRRKEQREKFTRRVVLLSQEMDAGIKTWEKKQQEKRQEEEKKRQNMLKPKGAFMKNP
ncbi:large ribosomal subunit protein mL52 isoform X3 [Petaurus breviceps papuanus]|uniref:large ribosomal subunit protein mL52 isoform X3 n=1 Tax=Petaurus breviceps papuanus TaxID=3040969 RepID=UPI0036D9226F